MKIFQSLLVFFILMLSNATFANSSNMNHKNELSVNITKPKILFFAGSIRKDSFNKKLAHNAYNIAKELDVDVKIIDLADYPLPLYNGDLELEKGLPENVIKLKAIFAEHDALFIASPEYNGSISPLLKNTLDWISRSPSKTEATNSTHHNKIIAISAASPSALGGIRGLASLQIFLSNIGCIVLPNQVTITNAYSKFDKAGKLIDTNNYQNLEDAISNLIHITTSIINN